MAASEVRVRRIVDYLNDGEELGVADAAETPPPRSPAAGRLALPRLRWPRLVRLGRKGCGGKGKEQDDDDDEVVVVAEKGDDPPVSASTSAPARESATTGGTRHSDLGLGLSLVFLLAKTSDEFNRMVKLRAEMEAVLEEFKHQVREHGSGNGHDHDVSKPGDPESATSSCVTVTDRNGQSASAHTEDQAVSSAVEAASRDKSSEDDDECCVMRMDVLEEEFHAELERLQVNYGSETPSLVAEEEEEEEHGSEMSDEIADYRHGVDDDLEEIVEDEEGDDDDDNETEYNGVSAVELERRLHELLHERNQDRIEELEAALRRAEKKLAEKEMEVCFWKDTAKLALRQQNELH